MYDISALGVKVVRAWYVDHLGKLRSTTASKSTLRAFNDVTEIPKDGVWFQVFHQNGTIEINFRENGLVRLDNIVKAATDNKLHVVFALTNNWFRGATSGDKYKHKDSKRGNYTTTPVDVDLQHLPRNFLSNDYG